VIVSHILTPEKEQPGTQGEHDPETKVDQRRHAKIRVDFQAEKDSPQRKDT
jgi:hypothetical protein